MFNPLRLPFHYSFLESRPTMPRGDKSKYTEKQKRQAEHIEEGYEKHGTPHKEAEKRVWATVNKIYGGGAKKGGSGQQDYPRQFPSCQRG